MAEQTIRFDDGAAYEQMMGIWSRSAGEIFLDWLAPPPGLRWIDVGCGNGAFTELLVERCAPVEVQGIDPSEGQLAFARTRPAARVAEFRQGDAMALPFPAEPVRRRRHGAGPCLRSRSGQGHRGDGAGGPPGRHRRDLHVGHAGRRLSARSDPRRDARDGPYAPAPAAAGRVAHGGAAGLVDRCRSRGGRDAGDHGAPDLRRFRRLLEDQTEGRRRLAPSSPRWRPEMSRRSRAGVRARLPADADGRITYGARANAIKGRVPR